MDDKRASITGGSWTFSGVAITLVCFRLYARLFYTRSAGWDDLFVALALLCAIMCSSLLQVSAHYGLGLHSADIPTPERQRLVGKFATLADHFVVASIMLGKVSVVFLLLRLMGPSASTRTRWFLYIVTAVSVISNTMVIITQSFCMSAAEGWKSDNAAFCYDPFTLRSIMISHTTVNASTDLILALFPAILFSRMQLKLRSKIIVIMVMGAGVFATGSSLVKIEFLMTAGKRIDLTWTWARVAIWYSVEMYTIIISATVPTLRQAWCAIFRPSYNTPVPVNSSQSRSSGRYPKNHIRRPVDASLFETMTDPEAQNAGTRQENILPDDEQGSMAIIMTTEVHVQKDNVSTSISDSLPVSVREHGSGV